MTPIRGEDARWLMVAHIVGTITCGVLTANNPKDWPIFAALGIASALLAWYWRGQIAPQLRVRCAWHPKFTGTELVLHQGDPGAETSDGICPVCAERLLRESAQ